MLIDLGTLSDKDIASMDEAKKKLVITAMHHTMTGPLWLAGKLSSTLAKFSLLGMYWDQGTGFTKAKSMMDSARGDMVKSAGRMSEIMTMLGDQTGEFQRYAQTLQSMADEMMIKTQIAETYTRMQKIGKTGTEIATAIEKIS